MILGQFKGFENFRVLILRAPPPHYGKKMIPLALYLQCYGVTVGTLAGSKGCWLNENKIVDALSLFFAAEKTDRNSLTYQTLL